MSRPIDTARRLLPVCLTTARRPHLLALGKCRCLDEHRFSEASARAWLHTNGREQSRTEAEEKDTEDGEEDSHKWSPKQLRPLRSEGRKQNMTEHIHRDSLDETLEAHRKANKASVIRYVLSARQSDEPNAKAGITGHETRVGSGSVKKELGTRSSNAPVYEDPARLRLMLRRIPRHDQVGSSKNSLNKWNQTLNVDYRGESRPWRSMASDLAWNLTAEDRLTREIENFQRYVQPSAKEEHANRELISQVEQHVRAVLPNFSVRLYGSRATGSHDTLTPFDFNLEYRPSTQQVDFKKSKVRLDIAEQQQVTSKLLQAFRDPKGEFSLVSSEKASRGLIALRHNATQSTILMTLESATVARTQLISDFFAQDRAHLSIFLLLRHSLRVRGLYRTKACYMTSYPLIVLIMIALRQDKVGLEGLADEVFLCTKQDSLISKLIKTLHFLGVFLRQNIDDVVLTTYSPFQYPKCASASQIRATAGDADNDTLDALQGICAGNSRLYKVKHSSDHTAPSISVQDPVNPSADVGRSVRGAELALSAFEFMRRTLCERFLEWEEATPEQRRKSDKDLIDCLVRGDWQYFERSRACKFAHIEGSIQANATSADGHASQKQADDVQETPILSKRAAEIHKIVKKQQEAEH